MIHVYTLKSQSSRTQPKTLVHFPSGPAQVLLPKDEPLSASGIYAMFSKTEAPLNHVFGMFFVLFVCLLYLFCFWVGLMTIFCFQDFKFTFFPITPHLFYFYLLLFCNFLFSSNACRTVIFLILTILIILVLSLGKSVP